MKYKIKNSKLGEAVFISTNRQKLLSSVQNGGAILEKALFAPQTGLSQAENNKKIGR